ncbi:MAG: hypothetical protein QM523_09600, partial [Candidatus Pacebacteria bacterium]|nr:hypothetical protein [Candidatus Paceibacterota bacterium]
GNGGRVIIWSDNHTDYLGLITARGGNTSGDGGFVEVSGAMTVNYVGTVDARAPHGKRGTLLIDPYELEIVTTLPQGGAVMVHKSYLSTAKIVRDLEGADISIDATGTPPVQNVTPQGGISRSYGTGNSGTIEVLGPIDSTGNTDNGSLILTGNIVTIKANIKIKGNLIVNIPTSGLSSASINFSGPSLATPLVIEATGDIGLNNFAATSFQSYAIKLDSANFKAGGTIDIINRTTASNTAIFINNATLKAGGQINVTNSGQTGQNGGDLLREGIRIVDSTLISVANLRVTQSGVAVAGKGIKVSNTTLTSSDMGVYLTQSKNSAGVGVDLSGSTLTAGGMISLSQADGAVGTGIAVDSSTLTSSGSSVYLDQSGTVSGAAIGINLTASAVKGTAFAAGTSDHWVNLQTNGYSLQLNNTDSFAATKGRVRISLTTNRGVGALVSKDSAGTVVSAGYSITAQGLDLIYAGAATGNSVKFDVGSGNFTYVTNRTATTGTAVLTNSITASDSTLFWSGLGTLTSGTQDSTSGLTVTATGSDAGDRINYQGVIYGGQVEINGVTTAGSGTAKSLRYIEGAEVKVSADSSFVGSLTLASNLVDGPTILLNNTGSILVNANLTVAYNLAFLQRGDVRQYQFLYGVDLSHTITVGGSLVVETNGITSGAAIRIKDATVTAGTHIILTKINISGGYGIYITDSTVTAENDLTLSQLNLTSMSLFNRSSRTADRALWTNTGKTAGNGIFIDRSQVKANRGNISLIESGRQLNGGAIGIIASTITAPGGNILLRQAAHTSTVRDGINITGSTITAGADLTLEQLGEIDRKFEYFIPNTDDTEFDFTIPTINKGFFGIALNSYDQTEANRVVLSAGSNSHWLTLRTNNRNVSLYSNNYTGNFILTKGQVRIDLGRGGILSRILAGALDPIWAAVPSPVDVPIATAVSASLGHTLKAHGLSVYFSGSNLAADSFDVIKGTLVNGSYVLTDLIRGLPRISVVLNGYDSPASIGNNATIDVGAGGSFTFVKNLRAAATTTVATTGLVVSSDFVVGSNNNGVEVGSGLAVIGAGGTTVASFGTGIVGRAVVLNGAGGGNSSLGFIEGETITVSGAASSFTGGLILSTNRGAVSLGAGLTTVGDLNLYTRNGDFATTANATINLTNATSKILLNLGGINGGGIYKDGGFTLTVNNAKVLTVAAGGYDLTAGTSSINIGTADFAHSHGDGGVAFDLTGTVLLGTGNGAAGVTYANTVRNAPSYLVKGAALTPLQLAKITASNRYDLLPNSLTATGNITIDAAVGFAYRFITTTAGTISFIGGASSFKGSLQLSATGAISQSATIAVEDTLSAAASEISLAQTGNSLARLGVLNSGATSIKSNRSLSLTGNISSLGATIATTGSGSDITIANSLTSNNFLILDASGAVSQAAGTTLTVSTDKLVISKSTSVNLTRVTISGVNLGTITSSGTVAITSTSGLSLDGNITSVGGATITTTTGNIALSAITINGGATLSSTTGGITIGAILVMNGNLTLNATGQITQGARPENAFTVNGGLKLIVTASSGIALTNIDNQISGLGALTSTGSIAVTSKWGMTLNGDITTTGTGATITIKTINQDLTLTDTIITSGGAVTIDLGTGTYQNGSGAGFRLNTT